MAGCVGGEEGQVAGGEIDEGVEDGGACGGEARSAEDVEDWGAEEGGVERVVGHCWVRCCVLRGWAVLLR